MLNYTLWEPRPVPNNIHSPSCLDRTTRQHASVDLAEYYFKLKKGVNSVVHEYSGPSSGTVIIMRATMEPMDTLQNSKGNAVFSHCIRNLHVISRYLFSTSCRFLQLAPDSRAEILSNILLKEQRIYEHLHVPVLFEKRQALPKIFEPIIAEK